MAAVLIRALIASRDAAFEAAPFRRTLAVSEAAGGTAIGDLPALRALAFFETVGCPIRPALFLGAFRFVVGWASLVSASVGVLVFWTLLGPVRA
ncbi:hypothetical protein DVW87_02680 [Sphingomonas aracearum]|uniref:Uncharacterized protein n=1 Tax=Sphingomonas aracearum TaxID=2283317 RepID=A0A369VYC1_9SPHN|nr:hypothetical protein DVW87_02680 [Sphingomonas aracearum]